MREDCLTKDEEDSLSSISERDGASPIVVTLKNSVPSIDKLNELSVDMDEMLEAETPPPDVVIHGKRKKTTVTKGLW